MSEKQLLSEKQYHIGMSQNDVGRYVLLPGDPARTDKIAQYFDHPQLVAFNREYKTWTGTLNGVKVSVMSTGMGGPSTAIGLEELYKIGADTFIRVGTCGGIDLDVKAGDLVIASGAIRKEGTSREYTPIEFPAIADFHLTSTLVKSAQKLGYPYHVGVVECKDSFYGQHSPEDKPVSYELLNKWEAWKRAGALASEMESAALFIVSSYLRARSATILYTVNNQERIKANLENIVQKDTDIAIRVAIDALKTIIEEDKKNEH